jgi:pimeloyl-ACP methyl ester carboxylesterase
MPQRSASPPADLWLDGGGIRVHALEWGNAGGRRTSRAGPVVVFLHGVAGNAWIWDDVSPRLLEALPDHRFVALDGRDGGDTDHPPTGYAREDFVDDLTRVHDGLGGGLMVLVGHSRGGWLAAWFAAQHPERVSRLILVDPARLVFGSAADAESFYAWVSSGLGPFESETAALAWARRADSAAEWTDVRVRSFLFGFRRLPDGSLVGKLPAEVVPQLRQAREGGEVVTDALARIVAPTLLLVAERQSPARLADKLAYAERIPDVRVIRLDGSHFLHTDVPDAVATAIAEFVRS